MKDYIRKYEKELLESVIPFWERHCIDKKYGGYFNFLDRDGSVFDTDKSMWMQWRIVYMFASLAETKYANEFIKYIFSESEIKEIAAEMAQKIITLQQTKDDLKAIKSDYKNQVDGIQAGINLSATKMTSGYEMRSVKCEVVPNYNLKIFKYIRVGTGEVVKEKKMTQNDLQRKIED